MLIPPNIIHSLYASEVEGSSGVIPISVWPEVSTGGRRASIMEIRTNAEIQLAVGREFPGGYSYDGSDKSFPYIPSQSAVNLRNRFNLSPDILTVYLYAAIVTSIFITWVVPQKA